VTIGPGETLLHYRLVEKIGEGGMGVVWKAIDTTLDREVAIKVLPDTLVDDDERLARLEREAKLLASLNHPNIAVVHGLHEHGGRHFLVLELVAGDDLTRFLATGALPLGEALDIAGQLAGDLEAAHEQGVIHRDLKPANVMRTPDGRVKILDFGLAKAFQPDPTASGSSPTMSPTLTSAGTVAGMILGTAAYMSPEQARGHVVDKRADIWAFGALLYEMLTGRQAFAGDTVTDTLASVLKIEPEWNALPPETPAVVRRLLGRCLTKRPKQRLRDIGEARIRIEEAITSPDVEPAAEAAKPAVARPKPVAWLPWIVTAVALALAAFFAVRGIATAPERAAPRRLMIPVPDSTVFGDERAAPPAVSPDGRTIVFGVIEEDGSNRLWRRPIDEFAGRPLAGTEGAQYPFWSPDSRHVGFFAGGKLKRIEVATGRVQTITDSIYARGGSWNSQGEIIFVPNSNTGVFVTEASGGSVRQLTEPDPKVPDASHRWPSFLPDGEHFLFVSWTNDLSARQELGGVYLASLEGDEEPRRIVADASSVDYVPPGFLLLVRGDNLIAIPFDARERRVRGDAFVVGSGVMYNNGTGHAFFSTSTEGTLVYVAGIARLPAKLEWYDRAGALLSIVGEPAAYFDLRLAPDSSQAAVAIADPKTGEGEIWVVDLARGVRTRLASGSAFHTDPVWSPAGDRVMYASQEAGGLDFYVRPADGSSQKEPVYVDGTDKELFDWSLDGRYLAYWPVGEGGTRADIWIYSLESQKGEPLLTGEAAYYDARFSPETRWIAYVTDESGRPEVIVQGFRGEGGVRVGGRWQVSTAGGYRPHWRNDGRELVYEDLQRRIMAVPVEMKPGGLVLGTPRELFKFDAPVIATDVTDDHQRFLIATRDETASEPLHVVLNWIGDLRP
jgi:Tol biopolymer transport system component